MHYGDFYLTFDTELFLGFPMFGDGLPMLGLVHGNSFEQVI